MSRIALSGNTSGNGVFTIVSPNGNTDRILTLPDAAGSVITTGSTAAVTPSMLSTGAPSWISNGDFQFNSGYGSVATAYGCRAWVNFNGTGTPAIRASGNVSSITDNGTGDYTINFTNAMPDANYSCVALCSDVQIELVNAAAGSSRTRSSNSTGTTLDSSVVCIAIFR